MGIRSESLPVNNIVRPLQNARFEGLECSVSGGKQTAICYCHSYTSFERDSNERINRDTRPQFPKGLDFSEINERRVQEVARVSIYPPRDLFGLSFLPNGSQRNLPQ